MPRPPFGVATAAAKRPAPLKGTETVIVARDPQMAAVVKLLKRLSKAPTSVLLSGESGTGKDLAAHALHSWGPRAPLPMVTLDLPSIPAGLMESELFGYERGAFTGAAATKTGKFEMAGPGTLYLDHIGELPPMLQAKLLRVVEDRRFERLGGSRTLVLESRIVASASADLVQAVERQLFRRDLFHRLGVFWIRIPPLRERALDIVPLAELFLFREVERLGRVPTRLSAEALEALQKYSWPGNVRELKGAVEHGALMSRTDAIERADLPPHILESGASGWPFGRDKRPTLSEVEKLYIERVLEEVGGNQTRAAEILGISRKSLWERRRRFDLK
jgi:two-component system, NtrC family, response regulator AtoC